MEPDTEGEEADTAGRTAAALDKEEERARAEVPGMCDCCCCEGCCCGAGMNRGDVPALPVRLPLRLRLWLSLLLTNEEDGVRDGDGEFDCECNVG